MMNKFLYFLLTLLLVSPSCKKNEGVSLVTPKSEYSVTAAGETISIKIITNQSTWGYDLGSNSWLKANKTENSLEVTVEPNPTFEKRSAEIIISAPENGISKTTIKITQNAKLFVPELSIDIASPHNINYLDSSFEINVSTNFETWESETNVDWVSLSAKNNVLTVTVAANPEEIDREGNITIYAPNRAQYEVMSRLKIVQGALVVEYPLENLSEKATSNSYIISHRGEYKFDAKTKGNNKGCEGLAAPTKLTPSGAKLVWQSVRGMITKVEYKDGEILFEASNNSGNALIAATNESGEIIWSWHIWRPEIEIESYIVASGDEIMNINLGALNADSQDLKCYGLLYQWGRKDPLPGSPIRERGTTSTKNVDVYDINGEKVQIGQTSMYSSTNNNLAFSISHPHYCISNNSQMGECRDWTNAKDSNPSFWGNPHGDEREGGKYSKGTKTFYDPCPVGWRVPDINTFQHFTKSGSIAWAVGYTDGEMHFEDLGGIAEVAIKDVNGDGNVNLLDFDCGWSFYLDKDHTVSSHFPATTRYDGSFGLLMGSMVGLWGNYWMNAPTTSMATDNTYLSTAVSFGVKTYTGKDEITVSPLANGPRADAYAIRCIKE